MIKFASVETRRADLAIARARLQQIEERMVELSHLLRSPLTSAEFGRAIMAECEHLKARMRTMRMQMWGA